MKEIVWPKTPPPLSAEQVAAREKFMLLWHQELPQKYGVIEKFNHGYVAQLPLKKGAKTLEIGAGLGEHAEYEAMDQQDYYFLEYRAEFCAEIEKRFGKGRAICGDIHQRQHWPDATFDRIVAVHVLEHLPHLPNALKEISRLLKDDGCFDIVIPCEGGAAYNVARRISSKRMFERNFGMSYDPIIKNEHVSTYPEIIHELRKFFVVETKRFFPLYVPAYQINLVQGMRLKKIGR